ncbi:unnamed protein product [Fraxinus pennsylvanica]|uniref:Uncharacterized protein n=1 Tax=Fraxinus pennsylvanica TaxID=56036 RepID=A0AAD1ZG81_9LAMI|nr:unnamed protein product [Fraxinus pennsylvanica]
MIAKPSLQYHSDTEIILRILFIILLQLQVFQLLTGETMVLNQEENWSSGIKFDKEGFLERCQNKERENPKGFDGLKFDKVYEDTDDFINLLFDDLPGDSFGMDRKISSLDAAIIRCIEAFDRETCGFKTKEKTEAMKFDDNKKVASVGSTLGSEEWSYEGCNALNGGMEDFLPFGFDIYCSSSCNLGHERKGLKKDGIRVGKDCAKTSLPNNPLNLDFNLPRDPFGIDNFESITVWIEDFGSEGHVFEIKETLEAKKVASDDYIKFSFDNYGFPQCDAALKWKGLEKDCIPVIPPDGLFFDLSYLGMRNPLSVEGVYKLPCDEVRNDPLPWRNIHIDHPLNDIITDDDLLRITNRAQGSLHSLSLVECINITATGLRRIFLRNPGLSKVSAVLKGEIMIVNKEGYIGYFKERRQGIRIDPADDSQSDISYEGTADDYASDKIYEIFTNDLFGSGTLPKDRSQSEMPYDYFGVGISTSSPDDCPTDPFGVDWRKGEFVASILDRRDVAVQQRSAANDAAGFDAAAGVAAALGRLFPEYRPAASPSFVPLLHSNSQK